MLKNKIKWITAAVIILGTLFTTCEMPMGLGDPVDTVAPNVFIESPQDNTKMKAITLGNPIVMEGTWSDDIGVVAIEFQIFDKWKNNAVVTPAKTSFKITTTDYSEGWVTGKWRAEIIINAETATEYKIRVYALDKFSNKGMAEVNVQIDIIPPWVDRVIIQKHPNHPDWKDIFVQDSNNYSAADTGSITGKKDSLPNIAYYRKKGLNFNNTESWRDIKYDDIDEFQNEFFRISAELIATFDNVAATKLNIYSENGVKINEVPLVRTGYTRDIDTNTNIHLRYPYWDIDKTLFKDPLYASGPHYIYFEIRAWSLTDWTGDDITGAPNKNPNGDEEQGRIQTVGGTVWFPESNNPITYIDKKLIMGETNSIILPPNMANALDIEVYDDDLLSNIYLGLIKKDEFDTLRQSVPENTYLESLAIDSNGGLRTAVMSKCIDVNPTGDLYSSQPGTNNRKRTFSLSTKEEGEYRLIAIVKEASLVAPYSYPSGFTPKWSVYPPLRVQVQAAMAPLIIVENPLTENAFPKLNSDGQTFTMSGYSLAGAKINRMFIAWVPQGKSASDATTALAAAQGSLTGVGDLYTHSSGVKVWDIYITDKGQEKFGANNFYRTDFTKTFDLLTDFPDGGVSAFNQTTKSNLFIIQANTESIGNNATKNYRLIGSGARPTITVTSHSSNTNYHDRKQNLVLRMQVGTGTDGVKIKEGSQKITDITGGADGLSALTLSGGEWQRTVTSAYIEANFSEGSSRVYKFEAENILGNEAPETLKTVIMSNAPLIESILCSNGSGSYGLGEKLTFDVTFTMPVLVTPSAGNNYPSLKLYFTNASAASPNANATYVQPPSDQQGKASNTLQFEYTVKAGDESPKLMNSIAPLETNGATLASYQGGVAVNQIASEKSMQATQTVVLDGIRPKVLRAAFKQEGETRPTYFANNKLITVNLLCSESVMVSGTPKIRIKVDGQTGVYSYFDAEYSSKSGNTLIFTSTINDPESSISTARQLVWADPWITFPTANDTITDNVGNPIDVSTASLPSDANQKGGQNGTYSDERGYIITKKPNTPTLSIHTTQPGAQNNTTGTILSADPLNTSGEYFYIRTTGIQNPNLGTYNTVHYSFAGGSAQDSEGALGGTADVRYSITTTGRIRDVNYASRGNTTYTPSSYQVTVWQTDLAGNESEKAAIRTVNINSRPADLTSIDINLNDGSHKGGIVVPFKLSFSQKITVNANATVTLSIVGTAGNMTGSANNINLPVTATSSTNPAASLITVNWTVPTTQATMKDIKVTNIQFTNMVDEYGNALTRYYGMADDNGTQRPIGNDAAKYTFQINRPDLEIRSNRPLLVQTDSTSNSTSPVIPTGTAELQNGGIAPANNVIRLVFAEGSNIPVDLSAVPGKYITIRPYGTWAIPPELSLAEFNTVYNFDYGSNNATYRRRLQDVDNDGIPKSGSVRGSGYNSYIKNTHGLTGGSAGNVRPDTATKMILDFTVGLYDETNANNLRTIFNAAGWKQQKILVTSSYVQITKVNGIGNIIQITPPTALESGRIWEVLVDDGAFQDAAGNLSQAVLTEGYRFWSYGRTATPYIRADKVSYDANNHGENAALGFVNSSGVPQRPPIDTRVRIDCETPGADIRYDVIRTSYTLDPILDNTVPAQVTAKTQYTSLGFISVRGSAANFFQRSDITSTNGYTTNNIGNDATSNVDSEGFFTLLLVPNTKDTGPTLTLSNGTFAKSILDNLGNSIPWTGSLTGNVKQYVTYSTTNGARTWHSPLGDQYIYIGELYPGSPTTQTAVNSSNIAGRTANADNDIRLFSGRRDYIVATAKKSSVSGNTANKGNSGPALDNSLTGSEGVYKTALLYRNPQKGGDIARLLVQGFDVPVMPVVAGFPLRDANSTNSSGDTYNNYFSKCAWRYGITSATSLNTNASSDNNKHIWVTWEIVTDWYQKGKGYNGTSGNYMNNNEVNANSVTATYGGVIYRYQQNFY